MAGVYKFIMPSSGIRNRVRVRGFFTNPSETARLRDFENRNNTTHVQYGLCCSQLSLALTCNMQRNSLIFCTDLRKLLAVSWPVPSANLTKCAFSLYNKLVWTSVTFTVWHFCYIDRLGI